MLLEKVYEEYIRKCKVTVRPPTVGYNQRQLGVILKFLKSIDVTKIEEVSFDTIYQYIEYRRSNGIKNVTINKAIAALKQALIYMSTVHNTPNPIRDFPRLKQEYQETKIIPEVYLKQILQYVNNLPKRVTGLRHRAMVYLLIDTGIRLNELLHLRVSNIDFDENMIRLTYTKTHQNRTVYISDDTKEAVLEYIKVAHIKDYLMVVKGGKKRCSHSNLAAFLDKVKMDLELPEDLSISFHKFRHTYATTCLENGASLEFVRSTLGHSTLKETQKYLHLSNDIKQSQHRDFGPFHKRSS